MLRCAPLPYPGGVNLYAPVVAYDEDLADRIRELLAGEEALSEQRMFGGLKFALAGNMAVAASGRGGLLVRVERSEVEGLLARTKAEPAVMGGRTMRGWVWLASEHVRTKRQLQPWVARGVAQARSLPPKGSGS